MFLRSSGVNRSTTVAISSMKCGSRPASVQGVARILLQRKPPFGEIDRDAGGACGEGLADVLLALVDQVRLELLARVVRYFDVQRAAEATASTAR